MAECVLVPTEPKHLHQIAPLLRDADARECAAAGVETKHALWQSYRGSAFRETAYIGDELAAVYGIAGTPLSGIGEGWLLTTNACQKSPLSFVKTFRRRLSEILPVFPYIYGYVADSYVSSIGLLKLLGFNLSEPIPMAPTGIAFRRYEIGERRWA